MHLSSDQATIEQLAGLLDESFAGQLAGAGSDPAARFALAARLQADLAALASFVPAPLLREQLAAPHPGRIRGAYWHGSLLFADLSGFTALSGKLSELGRQGAEEISAIITAMFSALVAEVHRHNGSLLKFGGDALTAFFAASESGTQHAALACSAALAMQRRMAAFRALSTRAGTFTLRLRIGVHAGQVFAAQVGDQSHSELVVTGPDVNRVALAQEIAEPGEVVVSSETLTLLPEATMAPRQAGFLLLTGLATSPALPTRPDLVAMAVTPPAGLAADQPAGLLAFAERRAALLPYLPHGLPRRFLSLSGGEEGEFRPVTTLFAHFWPFNAVLEALGDDAEAAARALNVYYRRAQLAVHRYGGIINKVDMYTRGDKLMALFGAPIAHGDDAERAVRAALELRQALYEANQELAATWDLHTITPDVVILQQRIGINSGTVFAGIIGGAERHEYTVMGQPVNLAARLMGAAAEGTVVVSASTRRAVETKMALRDLPPVQLKGVNEPVALAEVLRALHHAHLARPQRLLQQTVVGRVAELAQLAAAGQATLSGHGRLVAMVGEAGTGKTCLIDECLRRLAGSEGDPQAANAPFALHQVVSQSYEQTSPFATLRNLLRSILDLEGDAGEAARRALEQANLLAPAMARFAPLLGELLGLPIAESTLTAALSPEQRHARARELAAELVLGAARRRPLVIVLDDLHWADDSSLDLLGELFARLPQGPLLVLLAYRPEHGFHDPWQQLAHCLTLEIGELPPAESAALLGLLLDGVPSPDVAALLARTQGNPLFIEELVRTLRESGALQREHDQWLLSGPLDQVHIPGSLEELITARLDRLEERSRATLQLAAVVGQRFAYRILADLVSAADDLAHQIERLGQAALISELEPEPERAYHFRHNLIRDVTYNGLLFARRRELHRRVADVIVAGGGDHDADQWPLLARHYLLAEIWPQALEYHLRAGRLAQQRFANHEAVALFTTALQITERETAAEPRSRAEIYERLGWLRMLLGEYERALEHYHAALQATGPAAMDERLRLYHHIAQVYEKRAEFETAFSWVDQARALPGAAEHPALTRCLLLGAGLSQRQGRYQQARDLAEQALADARRHGNLNDQAEALMLLGGVYSLLGENARALELTAHCLEIYRQTNELNRLADAHNNLALICFDLGRIDEAKKHYTAGAELKQAIGDIYGEALIANNLGDLFKLQGDLEAALDQFKRALLIFERLGSAYGAGVLYMNLGATHLLRGDLAAAAEDLASAGALFARAGAEDFLPELERYEAELLLQQANPAAAHTAALAALETARRLAARAEEGATRRLLGRILAALGEPAAAWAELEQSIGLLRESDNSHELARSLLAQAALAPALGQLAAGQAALAEALAILRHLGARRELAEAEALAANLDH